MRRTQFNALVLCAVSGWLAAACGTMHYDPRVQSTTTASNMSSETAERTLRATVAHSYPITHKNARISTFEITPQFFKVAVFEKGEPIETKECTFNFGKKEPLRVWATDQGLFFVQMFEDKCGIHWHDLAEAKRFADALGRVEKLALDGNLKPGTSAAEDFKKVAEDYRRANPKPALSEEARKYKVIAENAFDEKRYGDALDYFDRALRVAPWWPEGHYNRALLLARENNLSDAITEMKMYLELSPEAKDARGARDKMYIWEAKVEKSGNIVEVASPQKSGGAFSGGMMGARPEAAPAATTGIVR